MYPKGTCSQVRNPCSRMTGKIRSITSRSNWYATVKFKPPNINKEIQSKRFGSSVWPMLFKCQKKTLKWNPNVAKLKTLCGVTSNVQQMARGQSVVPVVQTLYEALLTIQPTSVEAERAFSACGLNCCKTRVPLPIQQSMRCAFLEMCCRKNKHYKVVFFRCTV